MFLSQSVLALTVGDENHVIRFEVSSMGVAGPESGPHC
jgi:hypothetical protein